MGVEQPDQSPDSQDERVGRILNEYLDRKQRGEPVCEQDLIAANPDVADDLREMFGLFSHVIPATPIGAGEAATPPLPRDSLPGYELLGEIHRGGQGVVYQALQKNTHREVAIKVMREGPFAGWRDGARFEREVQILAGLRHPSIVTIHDSGTSAGCHYFVMDYIAGAPLDLWLTAAPRSLEQILRVFATICDAVNAAHVKGIMHRDLKPGNIRIDENNKPYILDFGLAKDVVHGNGVRSPNDMTAVGQFVGSLPWTSPEQAQGHLDQIDTRTDVYALGVILYHMLTGRFPYEVVGPARDVLNRIVTADPIRPTSLRPGMSRDVEAIVLKCLRKEPQRRYQTAGELGADVERYLAGKPIQARSDSGLYVLSSLLRRYRVPVVVAAAFALLVSVSLVASVSLWRLAIAQRNRADAEAAQARQARLVAEHERERAESQAEQLRRTTYLKTIALAQNAFEQKYLNQAQHLLDSCPIDLRRWEWNHLYRLARQPTLLDVLADSQCVLACAVSPDGHRVVTSGGDGILKIWDADTGAPLAKLRGHTAPVTAVAWSPDGKTIASAGRDKSLRLWDVHTSASRVLEHGVQYIHDLAFSPDSANIVYGGQGKVLTWRDTATGRVLRQSAVHDGEVSCVAYSPDGQRVATGEYMNLFSNAAKLRIWNAASGELVREITAHPAGILCIAFSADGSRIASGSNIPANGQDAAGTLKVFEVQTGDEVLSVHGHEGIVEAVAFSPDGTLLASAGSPRLNFSAIDADRTLRVWNAQTGAEVCTYSGHAGGGRTVAWSPDSTRIFSGGMDGRLKAWPRTAPPEARKLEGHSGSVLRVAFSPDGRQLASAGGPGQSNRPDEIPDNSVRIWDVNQGTQTFALTEHTAAVLAVAWSPDGKTIASGSVDASIRLWDAANGQRKLLLVNQDGPVEDLAFAPAGDVLASASGNTLTLWNVADGQQQQSFRQTDALQAVCFSPDGAWLATGSQPGTIRIYDRKTSAEPRTITSSVDLNAAVFSPDSATLATAHKNGTILLWHVATGKLTAAMIGPERSVQWLDFSPDGQRLASCTTDMMLKLWDVPSASEVYAVRAHAAPVTCVRFSPDGNRIATCSQDSLVKIWDGSTKR